MSEHIQPNPEAGCPPEVLAQQQAVKVDYLGFDGKRYAGIIEVHKDLVTDVSDFFDFALSIEFPIENVTPASAAPYFWDDEKLMAANVSSGFNYRTIAGTNQPSLHRQGRAFDVNPRLNPYIRYVNGKEIVQPEGVSWDPKVLGTLYGHHPLVELMKNRGWEWGGDWKLESGRTDYQHFEKPGLEAGR